MIARSRGPWRSWSQNIPSHICGRSRDRSYRLPASFWQLSAAVLLTALLAAAAAPVRAEGAGGTGAQAAPVASRATAAEGLVRFHVVAHSDQPADQALKRSVRDALLARYGRELAAVADEAALEAWVASHRRAVVQLADGILSEAGASYRSRLVLDWADFPETRSGPLVFPPGRYRALQLVLGDGAGHNWWCVLFPPLCVVEETEVSRLEARPAEAALPAFTAAGAPAGEGPRVVRVEWRWRFLETTEPPGSPSRLATWWETARRLVAQGAARLLWQPAHAGPSDGPAAAVDE